MKITEETTEEIWVAVNQALDQGRDPLAQEGLKQALHERPELREEVLRLRTRLALLAPVAPPQATQPQPSTSWHLAAGVAAAALLALATPAPQAEPEPGPASVMLASSVEVEHLVPHPPQPTRIDRSATKVVVWTLPREQD